MQHALAFLDGQALLRAMVGESQRRHGFPFLIEKQETEADFAYYYQSRARVTTCVVSNVSAEDSSAAGTINLSFADGSTETYEMQLIMENNVWKIHGQTSP